MCVAHATAACACVFVCVSVCVCVYVQLPHVYVYVYVYSCHTVYITVTCHYSHGCLQLASFIKPSGRGQIGTIALALTHAAQRARRDGFGIRLGETVLHA